jgi:hypothetical protein
MLNLPVYTRANPGNDFAMARTPTRSSDSWTPSSAYFDRKAVKSKSAWEFILDCFVGKGGVCVGSCSPRRRGPARRCSWTATAFARSTGATAGQGGRGLRRRRHGSLGQGVQQGRRRATASRPAATAPSRSSGAYLPPRQTYPLIVDDQLLALFIERKTTLLELKGAGWDVAIESGQSNRRA